MSILSEQVKNLRKMSIRQRNNAKVSEKVFLEIENALHEAADTIEALSAKLAKESFQKQKRFDLGELEEYKQYIDCLRLKSSMIQDMDLKSLLSDASDDIEVLTWKLREDMERSKRYYNSGWILCSNGENLPKEAENDIKNGWSEDVRPSDYVLCESTDGNIFKGFYSYAYKTWADFKECHEYEADEIIRWKPLPEPYKPQ